jgi:hypothetical protein
VPGLLSLAAVLALAPAPVAPELPELPSEEQCKDRELDLFVGFGPRTAPMVLKVYVDAVEPNQLRMWLEARRIAGERGDELRIELIPTRGGVAAHDPEADTVRLWFSAAAALGRAEQALRLIEHQDWRRVAAQVRTREGRAALARDLDLDPAEFEARRSGAAGACLERSFERYAKELAIWTMGQRMWVVGVVGRDGVEQIHTVDTELNELRTLLDRAGTSTALHEDTVGFIPFAPSMGAYGSRLDRTFPSAGVLVGGDALPHRLLIFVEDEEHGRLSEWLAPAMRYRQQHPGVLSIQVIAAGVGSRAIAMRRRLCAARTLGLEVEYIRHLADRPAVRRLHEEELYSILQDVADSDACSDSEPLEPGSTDHGSFGQPRGAWLDGRPVSPNDLDSLEWQLGAEQAPSLIDWLTTPDPLVGESFEFAF